MRTDRPQVSAARTRAPQRVARNHVWHRLAARPGGRARVRPRGPEPAFPGRVLQQSARRRRAQAPLSAHPACRRRAAARRSRAPRRTAPSAPERQASSLACIAAVVFAANCAECTARHGSALSAVLSPPPPPPRLHPALAIHRTQRARAGRGAGGEPWAASPRPARAPPQCHPAGRPALAIGVSHSSAEGRCMCACSSAARARGRRALPPPPPGVPAPSVCGSHTHPRPHRRAPLALPCTAALPPLGAVARATALMTWGLHEGV
ncbi:MAG: hypothetical protein J3K34DRAFT_187042 [Monoraphidium minutum]|nr:MAG: hypothetical protein J3K34DRAFT_187042 [Monoraphidium minutum]